MINIPSTIQNIKYDPTANPEINDNPTLAKPIGVGEIAHGGNLINVRISLGQFTEPVDIFFGLRTPTMKEVYVMRPDNSFLPASDGIVPWKNSVSSSINERIFTNINTSILSPGIYTLYLGVAPASHIDKYYLWYTTFTLHDISLPFPVPDPTPEPIPPTPEPAPPIVHPPVGRIIGLQDNYWYRFSLGPKHVKLFYFSVTNPPLRYPVIIVKLEPQYNMYRGGDMLVKYVGKTLDKNKLPTFQDLEDVKAYCQPIRGGGGCQPNWDHRSKTWSPPRYKDDLYYGLSGDSFELVEIYGDPLYPLGCYYILVYNNDTSNNDLKVSYTEY